MVAPPPVPENSLQDQLQTAIATQQLRRSEWSTHSQLPSYYDDFVVYNVEPAIPLDEISVPKSYKQVLASPDRTAWNDAMNSELNSLDENQTYTLVPWPKDHKVLPTMWLFTRKKEIDNTLRFKAHTVVLGNHQEPGLNLSATYAPTMKYASLRVLLAVAVE